MIGKGRKDGAEAPVNEAARPSTREISIISSDMHIRGECETRGKLRVEGRIAGNIAASGLELTASGAVEGDVVERAGTSSDQPFVISGSVSGAVRAGRVEVRKGGTVSGGVVADEAVIQGRVQGGVQARTRLSLDESAEVEGDVLARRLALKEGGRVNGTIRMGDDLAIEGVDPPKEASVKEGSVKEGSVKQGSAKPTSPRAVEEEARSA